MLPYIISVDVLSLYFSNIHSRLQGHKYKGLICVAVYCLCRLVYKICQARHNKWKRALRKEVSQLKYENLLQVLDDLGHPVDISITDLSFEDLCCTARKKSLNDVRLAFQIRAVSADVNTNAIVDLIQTKLQGSLSFGIPKLREVEDTTQLDGSSSLLWNVPVSLAEVIHLQSMEATAGLSSYLHLEAPEDAVVVQTRTTGISFQLLKVQGAIPVLRTNVPQTAYITFGSSNPIFGVTRNPFKADRSPGGTCSGEAVIASARGSVLGVGTDIAGGLRIPAHFCGICGFKPTSQRVSHKGVTITVEGQNAVATCVGPMSSEVSGLVAFMKSVCVPLQHQLDPTVSLTIFNNELYESTEPLRVGFFIDDGHTKCVPSVRRTMMEAKTLLEGAGYKVVPFDPPDLLHMLVKLYLPVVFGDHFSTLVRHLAVDTLDSCVKRTYYLVQIPYAVRWLWSWWFSRKSPVDASLLTVRFPQSVSYWFKHIREITDFWMLEQWNQLVCHRMCFRDILFLLTLISSLWSKGPQQNRAKPSCPVPSVQGCLTYCVLFNLLDFPAGTIPISTVTAEDIADLRVPEKYNVETSIERQIRLGEPASSSLDLPVGVQVASLPYHDEVVLRVLRDLERTKK